MLSIDVGLTAACLLVQVAKDKPDAGIWGSGASNIRLDVQSVVDLNEEWDLENQQKVDDDENPEQTDPKAADDSNDVGG